jgi:hypothetical protein
MTPKYVVIKHPAPLGETLYIFPEHITHAAFARHNAPERAIISAGFVGLRDNEICCYGHSESLNVASRPEDTELLNIMFGRTI